MADPNLIEFIITGVRHRYMDAAQRYALTPLTGPMPKDTASRDAATARRTEKLIEEWRARVYALREQGWRRPEGKALIYTLNCPPVGVVTNRKAKPCNQYAICPFCWSRRYVKETYERLEHAYYSLDPKRRLPLDLVEVITTEWLPLDEWSLSRLFCWIHDNRTAYLKAVLPNYGAFQLFSIEPPDTRRDASVHCWRFQQRILAMVDRGQDSPPAIADYSNQKRTVQRFTKINKREIGRVVGRVARYPKQLMYGPKQMVAELLEMKRTWGGSRTKGFRMSGVYGLLRKSSLRESEWRR